MDKLDKYIDELFHQKLSGAVSPVPSSGADWLQISKTIRKKNFLRFSPGSFNVYYLSAAIGTLSTVSAFLLPDFANKTPQEIKIQDQNAIDTDSIFFIDSLPEANNTSLLLNHEKSQQNCIPSSNNIEIKVKEPEVTKSDSQSEISPINSTELNSDSIENTSNSEHKDLSEPVLEQIIQPDTVIQVDTIRIQKKRFKIKRKSSSF